MKFHSAAANGLATGAFQKCNWGQINPMVDRGLKLVSNTEFENYYCIILKRQLSHHSLGTALSEC